MLGVFTTTKYASRAAYERRAAEDVLVSHNQFTDVGLQWMWSVMVGGLRNPEGGLTDHLGAARIVVGNGDRPFTHSDQRLAGDQTDQAQLDPGFPGVALQAADGDQGSASVATFQATFGERQAVFDWQERGIVTAGGVLLDRAVQDQGRKVLGAIWTVRADLHLHA